MKTTEHENRTEIDLSETKRAIIYSNGDVEILTTDGAKTECALISKMEFARIASIRWKEMNR